MQQLVELSVRMSPVRSMTSEASLLWDNWRAYGLWAPHYSIYFIFLY